MPEPEEGKTVYFPASVLPPVPAPAQWDAIASVLTYNPTINPIPPPARPGDFGRTDTRIEVNRSSATQVRGTFNVDLVIDNVITYWVHDGGRTNIASDADPSITQGNYRHVASDLTPSPRAVNAGGVTLLKNQPPRNGFWARDLTIKHEKFHADENEKFGREGADLGKGFLDRQQARNYDEVGLLLNRVSQVVAQHILRKMAPPRVEQDAYDAGAADYSARAQAIKTKGDARGYAPRPPAP
ncbi:MAG: hypothetical protein FJ316_11540 [SAR202 cluster bacterium]|nr:hypothetical protein [SAR202 cluster bacterium]